MTYSANTTDHTPTANPTSRAALDSEITVLMDGLFRLTALAGQAMDNATTALLRANLPLAQRVIDEHAAISTLRHELDDRAVTLLSSQRPTVAQLRAIEASLRVSGYLVRMGDVARHIADTTRRRHPRHTLPPQLRDTVHEMGEVAHRLTARTAVVISQRDGRGALQSVESAHRDRTTHLHEELFQQLLYGLRQHRDAHVSQDVVVLGRYFEQYAEHAVAVTRRIAHVAACADAWAAAGTGPVATVVATPLAADYTPDYDPDQDPDQDYPTGHHVDPHPAVAV